MGVWVGGALRILKKPVDEVEVCLGRIVKTSKSKANCCHRTIAGMTTISSTFFAIAALSFFSCLNVIARWETL